MSSTVEIPLQEILLATKNFAKENLIASGGYGPVYKGESESHGMIAVKRLDPKSSQGDVEFRKEIALLSEYKHQNIVSLLGFCDENDEKILVYKFERNGSLNKHLHKKDLSWIQRLRICLDAARGLKYLHDDVGLHQRILHRDVKSANILLDDKWNAKVSDFGLSRIGPANMQTTLLISNPCGTPGYIDPEYLLTGSLTQKSDVYSFGVVLFEVLCGRPTFVTAYKDERQYLSVLVRKHYERQTLNNLIHFDIQNQIDATSLRIFTTIAYQCLKTGPERPTMNKVVQQLQQALEIQQGSFSKPWKYDVYLSFRGTDTRKIFVNHLSSYLRQQGINCFEHHATLAQGEVIDPFILNAIRESRIALVVFSENYVNSCWCLDELVYIMKCKEERDQLVIPIYYNVDPSDVRRQRGRCEKVFFKHKSANNDKVESWRKALSDAGSIFGWQPKLIANGNEANAIKIIGSTVLSKLLSLMPNVEAAEHYSDDDVDALTKTHRGSLASSSTLSIPASSSKSLKYDVFISFRGVHTRKTFVGHLYSYLLIQGIKSFNKDEDIPPGEYIVPFLRNTIQESRIALIIFSENYAHSARCLDELEYIMKCKEERGQIVIPIIYGVDQADVRKQKRNFGEVLSNHKWANSDRVESWREALRKASNIAAYIANGNEAEVIKDIGNTVLSKLLSLMPNGEASAETNADVDLNRIETHIR